jgi:hypothetical protein
MTNCPGNYFPETKLLMGIEQDVTSYQYITQAVLPGDPGVKGGVALRYLLMLPLVWAFAPIATMLLAACWQRRALQHIPRYF